VCGKTLKKWVLSVCGLNCAQCDIYDAGHGDKKKRDEIVEWFRKERNETIKPGQVRCDGCRGPFDRHWSPDCKMMLCARTRELQYCFECESFPCRLLEEFAADGMEHHKRAVERSKRMKEIGLKAWMAEQEAAK